MSKHFAPKGAATKCKRSRFYKHFVPTGRWNWSIVKKADCVLIPLLLLLVSIEVYGQTTTSPDTPARMMRNSDVIRMVEDGVKPGVIIANILTSHCNFDIFPPVLRDLRRRRVPDTVIVAMKMAPNGPPALGDVEPPIARPPSVTIPAGTVVELETATATSSRNSPPGTLITFLVTKRIYVNKVLVIDRGAVARAHVVKSHPARLLGRAGMIAWELEYVVGVDGSQIPIELRGKQSGANRTAALAAGGVATGALVFPYSSPVALIWGLKKGDEAVLRGSRVFNATVTSNASVAGLQPRPAGVVYRDRETVKASTAPPSNTQFPRGSFTPGGFKPK